MVLSVAAIDRGAGKTIAARWDPATGRFELTGLTVGRRYDLLVQTRTGRIEGVDLQAHPDLPTPASSSRPALDGQLSDRDRRAIERLILTRQRFADQVRILALRGDSRHATALVEKLRTHPFHDSKPGQLIWRVELWHLAWRYGGWMLLPDRRVIVRRRLTRQQFQRLNCLFSPRLGGIVARPPEACRPLHLTLPQRLDPTSQRVIEP
ncbi:MAG: hypothetical protein ACE5K7_03095 [Phycisphaerae bacterium]